MAPKTLERAKSEIQSVLRRYGVRWEDVAPDRDMAVWKTLRPSAKKVRKAIFRKTYGSV